ncbi:MAG: sigma-70 family RNA polymerase sigma factor [Bacteroidota bacterium]
MNTFKNCTDTQLITFFKDTQNPSAFGELYTRYNRKVFLYCAKILKDRDNALDVTQDIFVKISKKLNQLQDSQTFVKWLFTIAHNHCMDFLKKQNKIAKVSTEELLFVEDRPVDIEALELKDHALNQLEIILNQMPEQEGNLLREKYFEKKSIADLANKYHLSASAIKMRLARSRKKMEQLFQEPVV